MKVISCRKFYSCLSSPKPVQPLFSEGFWLLALLLSSIHALQVVLSNCTLLAHSSLEAPVHRNLRFLASIPCDQVAQVLYLSIVHYDGRRSATLRSTKVTSHRSLTTLERQLAKIDQNQQLSQPCRPPSQSEATAIQDFR